MPDRIGPYELHERIGSGGMGTVYRAIDTRYGTVVALKVLRDDGHDDASLPRRFRLESETLTRLRHPNIVRFLDAGSADGRAYIAMELVDGEPLSRGIERGPLAPEIVRQIGVAVASALQYAHDHNVIHRDIKPANILLGNDGSIKVADFGIAKVVDDTMGTGTGMFLGSLAYAAPEMFGGVGDARSDIYSLGVVLFECVSGVVPFKGSTPFETMALHRTAALPSPLISGADIPLQKAIVRSLAKSALNRWSSGEDLARALERPADPVALTRHGTRRRTLMVATAIAVTLLMTALLVGFALGRRASPPHDASASGAPAIPDGSSPVATSINDDEPDPVFDGPILTATACAGGCGETPFEVYVDCDVSSAGIQSQCTVPAESSFEVGVVLKNNSGAPMSVGSFNIALTSERAAISPELPGDCKAPSYDCNPDANQDDIKGDLICQVIPGPTPTDAAFATSSNLGCYIRTGAVPVTAYVPSDGSITLAKVRLTTRTGESSVSVVELDVGDSELNTLISCNPTRRLAWGNCFPASVKSE